MTFHVPIDKVGRMVLPKEIRKRLHLAAGDILEAVVGMKDVVIRPRVADRARITHLGRQALLGRPRSFRFLGAN